MKKGLLAQELRAKQLKLGAVPARIIKALSDDEIIDSYITCSCCGDKQLEGAELEYAISSASDTEHFFKLADKFGHAKHMVNTADA